jgi:hypothetical protein
MTTGSLPDAIFASQSNLQDATPASAQLTGPHPRTHTPKTRGSSSYLRSSVFTGGSTAFPWPPVVWWPIDSKFRLQTHLTPLKSTQTCTLIDSKKRVLSRALFQLLTSNISTPNRPPCRLEIVATRSKQTTGSLSNRPFFRGFHHRSSAATPSFYPRSSVFTCPEPSRRICGSTAFPWPPAVWRLIVNKTIRNRRKSPKTNERSTF